MLDFFFGRYNLGTFQCAQRKKKKFRWFNIFLSFLHAIFSSLACVVSYVENPNLYSPNGMGKKAKFFARTSIFITLGYFIFDFFDHARNFKKRISWIIIFHHIMIFTAYFAVELKLKQQNVLVAAYPAEINTVMLQIRLLLRFAEVSEYSLAYRLTAVLNLITFFVFRFTSFAWIFLYYYWYVDYTESAIHVLTILIAISMNLFNVVLLTSVVNTDYIKKIKKSID